METDATGLRRALDQDEFFPAFSRSLVGTGLLTGFELLARWRHATPDGFIPWIEASGLISRLTQTLLDKAFASEPLAESSLHLSFNFRRCSCRTPESRRSSQSVPAAHFALDRLTIEVTESALLKDLTRANEIACELKQLGCRFALDDFGTGYSSLLHLQSLPFDKLKVDRSFVSSMTDVRESRKIVAAVVGLGESLELTTVPEGTETSAEASMLLWLGCDLGQGGSMEGQLPLTKFRACLPTASNLLSAMPSTMDGTSIIGFEFFPHNVSHRSRQSTTARPSDSVSSTADALCQHQPPIRRDQRRTRPRPSGQNRSRGHSPRLSNRRAFHPRALEGEAVLGMEVQKPSADGRDSQTVLLNYQPARDEAGEVLGVSVAVMDITGPKRTEEAFRESIDHFRHMLDLGPHVPWVLNEKGDVIDASSRWTNFTGQPLETPSAKAGSECCTPMTSSLPRRPSGVPLAGEPIDIYYRSAAKPENGSRCGREDRRASDPPEKSSASMELSRKSRPSGKPQQVTILAAN